MSQIKIYGKDNCIFCKEAVSLAKRYELKYDYIDVGYTAGMDELKEKLPDVKTVPQIWWHDRHIGGYKEFQTEVENTIINYGQGLF